MIAERLLFKCPECGTAVARRHLRARRDAEMLEAYRQGVAVAELAERYCIAKRTVFHALARARQQEKGRVTA